MRFFRVLKRVRDKIQRKYFCERGLGRGENNEGIIKGTSTSLEVEPVSLPPSIRRRFQLVEQSPRVLQWYLLLPCLQCVLSGGLLRGIQLAISSFFGRRQAEFGLL